VRAASHPCSLCGPAIVFLTSKISYLFIPNFTHNTETATAKGRKLLIATHLDQSNYLVNQQQVLGFVVPLANLTTILVNAGLKTILLSQTGMF
jgi:hypothetical protein